MCVCRRFYKYETDYLQKGPVRNSFLDASCGIWNGIHLFITFNNPLPLRKAKICLQYIWRHLTVIVTSTIRCFIKFVLVGDLFYLFYGELNLQHEWGEHSFYEERG